MLATSVSSGELAPLSPPPLAQAHPSDTPRRARGRKPACRPVPVPEIERRVQVTIASKPEEWMGAFQLVAASYQARGYEVPTGNPYRFTPFHALPETTVFVAKHQGRVIATLSLVLDNDLLGLPMETVYGEEIAELRRAGRRLLEVTSLADEGLGLREFVPVFVTLMRLSTQYGLRRGADTWVISINPRHRAFYRKVLGFVPLGPWRAYPSVQNHPAEAYRLDPGLMRDNAPQMYERLLGEPLPEATLMARRMPPELVYYLGSHSSQTDREHIDSIFRFVQGSGSTRRW
jgi:hypothetical protein